MAADYTLIVGAYRTPAVDFSSILSGDATLVSVESETDSEVRPLVESSDDSGLTISDVSIIGAASTIGGVEVGASKAIQFRATAVTAGSYTIKITVKTSTTLAEQPIVRVAMDVID